MVEYDIVIIGGGPGGYVAAIRAAQLGARVALVEKERIGGTCLNHGCIPTKALVRSVETYLLARQAARCGVDIGGRIDVNFPRMMARKDEVVDTLVASVIELVKGHKVDIYKGLGTILKPGLVQVKMGVDETESNIRQLAAGKIIIATGSVPARLPIPGLDLPGVLTSRELLALEELPQSLAIVGGGVIGVEFASIFNALGTRVTVVEMLPHLLPPVDRKLARRFQRILSAQGVEVKLNAPVEEIGPENGRLRVKFSTAKGEGAIVAEKVLLAVGRWPCTEGLGVGELGLKMDGRRILVNEFMETSVPDIYAIGDVLGTYMQAHVASYEGEIAVENALGHRRAADYRAVPYCVFTTPELAGVGLGEREAKEQGLDYRVVRFPFSASGRALAMGETEGQVKMVCEKGSGRVMGLHIMGPRASDLIAEGALAIQLGATAEDIAQTIHAHPTLPEAVMEAAKTAAFGEAIHFRKV
ncbi:MAG TPA: dihydrolipoyl dehydrogenase [Anaerolineae bacterium]|nr:dihydrolipoyl dehydrogenase [Anaerolineae bacterium]